MLAGAALWVAGRLRPSVRRLGAAIVNQLAPSALLLAAGVAATCTMGSLYLSEVAGYPPCKLCWYQRTAMYPLALILGMAAFRKDHKAGRYVVPIALVGAVISAYHAGVERFPSLESGTCDPANPCSVIWVEHLGYITIPVMALSGFLLIGMLVMVASKERVMG